VLTAVPYLADARLSNANLRDADLRGANLSGADLLYCLVPRQLEWCQSQRCKLVQRLPSECQPELTSVVQVCSKLTLSGVDLSGANLQGCRQPRRAQRCEVENARLGGALGLLRN